MEVKKRSLCASSDINSPFSAFGIVSAPCLTHHLKYIRIPMLRKLSLSIALFLAICSPAQAETPASGQAQKLAALMQQTAIADSLGAEDANLSEIVKIQSDDPVLSRYLEWSKQYYSQKYQVSPKDTPLPGAVTQFFVSFPFASTSMFDFARPFSPESGYDTSKSQEGAMYPALNWMKYESTGNYSAVLAQECIDNSGFVTMFLATRIRIDDARGIDAYLEIPSSTPVVAWMNGKRVLENIEKGPTPAPKYGERWPIHLNAGENILTIKVAALETQPAFYVFLTDRKTGNPIPFKIDLEQPIVSGPLDDARPDTSEPSILSSLYRDQSNSPALRAYIAREIFSEEEADRLVNDLLFTDVEATSELPPDDLELAILALNNHPKSLQFMVRAMKKHANDPRMQLLYARQMILASEDQGDTGVRFVDEWPQIHQNLVSMTAPVVNGISYEPLRRKLIALSELNAQQTLTAIREISKDPQKCPECERYLIPNMMGSLTDRYLVAEHLDYLEKQLEHDRNSSALLVDIMDGKLRRAVLRNDESELAKTLAEIQQSSESFFKIHPYDDYFWSFWLNVVSEYGLDSERVKASPELAQKLSDAGFSADADTWFMLYLSQRVNDPKRWQRYAEHCLKTGQTAEVISAYEMASRLQPQDTSLSERSEMMKKIANHPETEKAAASSEPSFETPYIIREIPDNRDANATGLVSLLDNRVVKIHENGLSSTYNQIAFQILDEQGLKAVRMMPINYSPTDEKLEIISVTTMKKDGSVRRLYETTEYNTADESVKMYYDQRQVVIEVPGLAVGDRIEYQFRRTQIQRAASSVSFFSDIYQLQSWFNRQWSRYTIIAPESTNVTLLRHTPAGNPTQVGTSKKEGGNIVITYEEKDTPRLLAEPQMPGATEVMPFLLVSTFRTWQELTDWFIDLASPQWKADDAIRAKVQELTKGIDDPFEKLKRIHSFVVKSTRYVALEFGIHGHKPYPAAQIFERRFGDCKDKASLLKVMLREAGIESEFVLARTRQNGDVTLDLPNPYLFDHAILYVPQFDLFLDGTAEFSGTRELPAMDQDAQVLVLSDASTYKLQKIPVSKPSDNHVQQTWEFDLTQGQDVSFAYHADYSGYMAPSYRERYQIDSLQRERLESEIAYNIHGSQLKSFEFSDLSDLEKDVSLNYTATTTLSDIVKSDGSLWLVTPMVMPSQMAKSFASSAKRRTPIVQAVPFVIDKTITLILPPGAKVTLPEAVSESGKFGSYTITSSLADNRLTTQIQLTLTQVKIQPDDYPGYLDFLQSYDRRLNTQFQINLSK